eukprot:TRINITY_DN6960_c0_g2_i1.p1 TRINITY_DN6960_c0_g2~~TRINITY_DN6960_c0_g2_i1.p1  ORF type:complete len:124 (-),score=14.94 TRINITY_DN6960_c0_g2_i1:31-402(-)
MPTPGSLGSLATLSFSIDTTPPKVLSIGSTPTMAGYRPGDSINITMIFSETVFVYGALAFTLNTGGTMSYSRGNGSTILTFVYVVGVTDTYGKLALSSWSRTGGTVQDRAGNDATSTLSSLGW